MKLISFYNPQKFIHGHLSLNGHEINLSFTWDSLEEDGIVYPESTETPKSIEGLWNETCFELFLKENSKENYLEFNFSPNGCWNAYCFDSYRAKPETFSIKPTVIFSKEKESLSIQFQLEKDLQLNNLEFQLSAIIFLKDKTQEFFALAHPTGKPDFHSPLHFQAR